jgi:succinyl-CoA synthetase beta subunit
MQTRKLHVHEYLSQQLMSQFGVRVARGGVASTPEEAEKIARELGTRLVTQICAKELFPPH